MALYDNFHFIYELILIFHVFGTHPAISFKKSSRWFSSFNCLLNCYGCLKNEIFEVHDNKVSCKKGSKIFLLVLHFLV